MEAELSRSEKTARNGELAMGRAAVTDGSWRPQFDRNERTPALSRTPGYWGAGGERQPSQSRGALAGWLLSSAGGPRGVLWTPSRLRCGSLHGKLEPG